MDVVIDVGLAQDSGVDLALREGHVLDHSTEAEWQRIIAVGAGGLDDALIFSAAVTEERDGG